MDTVYVERDKCFHLSFVPNNSQDFGFTGHLYILADSTYRVKECQLNLPKKTDINFVDNMIIDQNLVNFLLVNGLYWKMTCCANCHI